MHYHMRCHNPPKWLPFGYRSTKPCIHTIIPARSSTGWWSWGPQRWRSVAWWRHRRPSSPAPPPRSPSRHLGVEVHTMLTHCWTDTHRSIHAVFSIRSKVWMHLKFYFKANHSTTHCIMFSMRLLTIIHHVMVYCLMPRRPLIRCNIYICLNCSSVNVSVQVWLSYSFLCVPIHHS